MTHSIADRIRTFVMDEAEGLGNNPDAEALLREAADELDRLQDKLTRISDAINQRLVTDEPPT